MERFEHTRESSPGGRGPQDSEGEASDATEKFDRRALLGRSLQAFAGLAVAGTVHQEQPAVADIARPCLPDRLAGRKSDPSPLKARATADYRCSMAEFGGQLSQPFCQLIAPRTDGSPWQFDVLIIGSGYGASICAARLAARLHPGKRLAIVERGKEWTPGTFPDTVLGCAAENRFRLLGRKKHTIHNPIGLYNLVQNDEVNVLSGSALGGTSIINANVAIVPDADVFAQPQWPLALRDRNVLDPYYELVAAELNVRQSPPDRTPKMAAQRLAARRLAACGAVFEPARLSVVQSCDDLDASGRNRQGVIQRPCHQCGDCTIGCNVGAKSNLTMNYLPLARRYGAEIYTQTEVIAIEKCAGYYRVHFRHYEPLCDGKFHTVCGSITARLVILGAGSLGSTEILLRSCAPGFEFSSRVGCSWTANGDALGFVTKSCHLTNVGGFGAYCGDHCQVGPTIQTNIYYPYRPLCERVLIQDGAVARAYVHTVGLLMHDHDLDHTLPLLGMGHDGAQGRITLDDCGHATVRWPGLKESAYRAFIRHEFAKVAEAHCGQYKYLRAFGDQLITVHPLGGCGMSDDPAYGVVNHKGQVYDGAGGGRDKLESLEPLVHEGLYVADGAILPTSIGVNPYLTISALAERIADELVREPTYADLFG